MPPPATVSALGVGAVVLPPVMFKIPASTLMPPVKAMLALLSDVAEVALF